MSCSLKQIQDAWKKLNGGIEIIQRFSDKFVKNAIRMMNEFWLRLLQSLNFIL